MNQVYVRSCPDWGVCRHAILRKIPSLVDQYDLETKGSFWRLHLGSKGFFTISFINLEDRDRVLDGGPYFYHSAGLWLRPWKHKLCQGKEDMRVALVWIRLYSLPCEYWDPKILEDLGNCLGKFIKYIWTNKDPTLYYLFSYLRLYGFIKRTTWSDQNSMGRQGRDENPRLWTDPIWLSQMSWIWPSISRLPNELSKDKSREGSWSTRSRFFKSPITEKTQSKTRKSEGAKKIAVSNKFRALEDKEEENQGKRREILFWYSRTKILNFNPWWKEKPRMRKVKTYKEMTQGKRGNTWT